MYEFAAVDLYLYVLDISSARSWVMVTSRDDGDSRLKTAKGSETNNLLIRNDGAYCFKGFQLTSHYNGGR